MKILKQDVESFGWKEKHYKPCYICGKRTLFRIRVKDVLHTRWVAQSILKMIPVCKACQAQIRGQ
mgnify:CR=1 FL=1